MFNKTGYVRVAAGAILAALMGQSRSMPTHGYVSKPYKQSSESIDFHLGRAEAKRARKAAILERLADAGAIGRAA